MALVLSWLQAHLALESMPLHPFRPPPHRLLPSASVNYRMRVFGVGKADDAYIQVSYSANDYG
eukprot:1924311-Amphidinium_carterae.1